MEVTRFDIEFTYRSRIFKAHCEKHQVHNYPQIRIPVDLGRRHPVIFIFYEVNWDNEKYFWFKLPDSRQEVAKTIAKALETQADVKETSPAPIPKEG